MLYKIAHLLRDHAGWIWELAEGVNSLLFRIRYGQKMKRIPEVLTKYEGARYATEDDLLALVRFFERQPEADFTYFRPHAFDEKTLRTLIGRSSFVACVIEKDREIVGYFFLRSFVHGVSYLGKMVDHEHQGQGIGRQMCLAAMDVALNLGIRMYESINRDNLASMRSTGAVLKQVILKELEHGDLLIEDLPL